MVRQIHWFGNHISDVRMSMSRDCMRRPTPRGDRTFSGRPQLARTIMPTHSTYVGLTKRTPHLFCLLISSAQPLSAAQGDCRNPMGSGAGEGNRTLVCSLGSCRSTIELRPLTYSIKSGTSRTLWPDFRLASLCHGDVELNIPPAFYRPLRSHAARR